MDPLSLVGRWAFWREVHDHQDGVEYTADGDAELTLGDDGRVRWTEHGTLRWAAGTTPVARTLFLVREPVREPAATDSAAAATPSEWRVTFEDGRDFHPWIAGAVEHLCGRDLYRGGIEAPSSSCNAWEPSWELTWRVTGPQKDYTLHTTYSQAPGH